MSKDSLITKRKTYTNEEENMTTTTSEQSL